MSTRTACVECPECTGTVRERDGEQVCRDCGLVVSVDRMDRGPEWRSFPDDETDRERTGAPLTRARHDRGLTTEIGSGGDLPPQRKRRLARMRRHHRRASAASKVLRNRRSGFTEIHRMADRLSLPDPLRERACVRFTEAQEADLLRGRSIEGFATAAVYAVCRAAGVARTIEEVVAVSRIGTDRLTTAYGVLNRELDVETGPVDPAQYLPRFASQLELDTAVERRAHELVDRAADLGLTNGRDPTGVAAGCLYTACREHDREVTQQAAAEVAGVAAATLRTTYQALSEKEG
jgi:transcription initiation factor TFIIB